MFKTLALTFVQFALVAGDQVPNAQAAARAVVVQELPRIDQVVLNLHKGGPSVLDGVQLRTLTAWPDLVLAADYLGTLRDYLVNLQKAQEGSLSPAEAEKVAALVKKGQTNDAQALLTKFRTDAALKAAALRKKLEAIRDGKAQDYDHEALQRTRMVPGVAEALAQNSLQTALAPVVGK